MQNQNKTKQNIQNLPFNRQDNLICFLLRKKDSVAIALSFLSPQYLGKKEETTEIKFRVEGN